MSTEDQEEKKVYIQDWDELPYFEKEQNLTLKNKFKEINVLLQFFFNFLGISSKFSFG